MARSTNLQMRERHDAIMAFVKEQNPVTLRGVYYHLSVLGLVPKDDPGYQKVAVDCKKLRQGGEMPYEWITDNTRQAESLPKLYRCCGLSRTDGSVLPTGSDAR